MRPPRSAVKALAAAVLAGALATGVSACGSTGTNGVATKSVGTIVATAKDAVTNAATFHVIGDLGTGATHITLDLWLAKGKGASGRVTIGSQTLELLRIGSDVYLKGDAAFYSSLSSLAGTTDAAPTAGGSGASGAATPGASGTPAASGASGGSGAAKGAAATPTPSGASASDGPAGGPAAEKARAIQAMQGKYLHIGPADAKYQLYASLTDPGQLVDQILSGIGALSKDGQQSVNGVKTLVLTGSAPNSHVYVGIDGPAYLLRVIPAGGGTLDFKDYGTPVTLTAPAKTELVDMSQIPNK